MPLGLVEALVEVELPLLEPRVHHARRARVGEHELVQDQGRQVAGGRHPARQPPPLHALLHLLAAGGRALGDLLRAVVALRPVPAGDDPPVAREHLDELEHERAGLRRLGVGRALLGLVGLHRERRDHAQVWRVGVGVHVGPRVDREQVHHHLQRQALADRRERLVDHVGLRVDHVDVEPAHAVGPLGA